MDPKQALIDLLESIACNDQTGARDAFESILEWTDKGGFIPKSIHSALDALRFAEE
jgi:hypothetical protein